MIHIRTLITILLVVFLLSLLVDAAFSQQMQGQQGAFRPSSIPTVCAGMDHAITEMKYFENVENQKIVATWNDARTNAYGILLYYIEENAFEMILIDPSRTMFCVISGGELITSKSFPGLQELLRARPI